MIAKGLEASGWRVGLYTSPHLFSFCERMQINGISICQEELEEYLIHIYAIAEDLHIQPTFFEFLTCAAFLFFQKREIDIAVVETGLGGRWDATNILYPILSVITSISLEHCQILGHDLNTIAGEKAGIFKQHVPAVIGPHAHFPSVLARVRDLGIALHRVNTNAASFVDENRAIASACLKHLPFAVSQEAISAGLEYRLPCRCECLGNAVLDVAHNPYMIERFIQAVRLQFPGRKLRIAFGCLQDKEHSSCLELLLSVAEHIHLIQAKCPRATPLTQLARALDSRGYHRYSIHDSIANAMEQGYRTARSQGELFVVTGSTYIMAEARETLLLFDER